MRALILEDNRDRRVAMIGRLAERFPFLQVNFFDASAKMIDFLKSDNLQDVAIISLDHDLEMLPGAQGDWIDPGTGLDVARWLANRSKPLCPVVVHTTNSREGAKMMRLFEKAHWLAHRVIPYGDLEWIEADWFRIVRKSIVGFAPQPLQSPVLPVENKISFFRSLLEDQYECRQTFCRVAMAKIADAYGNDLRRALGDISVEVMAFDGKDRFTSVFEVEGRTAQGFRDVGIPAGALSCWAERGPLGIEKLELSGQAAQRLIEFGLNQIQITIIEDADMQAVLIVSAERPLSGPPTQAIIIELKKALEIALFFAHHLDQSRKLSETHFTRKGLANVNKNSGILLTPSSQIDVGKMLRFYDWLFAEVPTSPISAEDKPSIEVLEVPSS